MTMPQRKPAKTILPPEHPGDTDEERRLREFINRVAGQLLGTLDAALALRTAPAEAQRERHNARSCLEGFGLHAMNALQWARTPQTES